MTSDPPQKEPRRAWGMGAPPHSAEHTGVGEDQGKAFKAAPLGVTSSRPP